MKTPAPLQAKLIRAGFSAVFAVCASAALLVSVGSALAQIKSAVPATITSITQTIATVAGVPTLLTVTGTGNCKYRLSYVKQGAPLAAQSLMTYSSTSQSPFPMSLKLFDATPAGTYTWTANGIEGCAGAKNLTFTVP